MVTTGQIKTHMQVLLAEDPSMNSTQLAESTAWDFNHDEWLDDETHEVWDIAFDVVGDR